MNDISASIVIPTRARPDYLQVALRSIAPQAAAAGAEVLVVEDDAADAAASARSPRATARAITPSDGRAASTWRATRG